MATTEMDYENANGNQFEDEAPRYDRRSASPRRDDEPEPTRRRSASPGGNDRSAPKDDHGSKDDDGAVNPGSNLFVTGIHPRLSEDEVTRLFEKYGDVEKCQIMKDPHSGESRGFGFVKMVTPEQADAAKDGLQGEVIEGRTLSIEKARRARPRTPTPGKYFGPPKRGRFDDRRRGGFGGSYGGREEYRGYRGREDRGYDRGYERNYERGYDRGFDRGGDRGGERGGYDRGYREDRGYDRGYREDRGGGYERRGDRDEYSRGGDRYGSGREDREQRYGGGSGGSGGGSGGGRGGREDRGGYDRDRFGGDREARPRDGPSGGGYSGGGGGGGSGGDSGARGGDSYGAR